MNPAMMKRDPFERALYGTFVLFLTAVMLLALPACSESSGDDGTNPVEPDVDPDPGPEPLPDEPPARPGETFSPPAITGVEFSTENTEDGDVITMLFSFQDDDGDVVEIDHELISIEPEVDVRITDGTVSSAPAAQRSGTVVQSTWSCGTSSYTVTLQTRLIDAQQLPSPEVEYDVFCNGP